MMKIIFDKNDGDQFVVRRVELWPSPWLWVKSPRLKAVVPVKDIAADFGFTGDPQQCKDWLNDNAGSIIIDDPGYFE